MNSVIIDKQNESLHVKAKKLYTTQHTIPLALIDLLVVTETVDITTKNLLKLTDENIAFLHVSNDNKKMALTLPAIAKNGELKQMQYNALQKRVLIAKRLVSEKFLSHKVELEKFDQALNIDEALASLAMAKDIETIMGIEGAFAKRYFGHYFMLFEKKLTKGYRSKNPPRDPVNAMLSFVYTLAYNTLTAKLYMRGFDPSISYLHTPFRSHFALSSDLLEPLRAMINTFVANLFLDNVLNSSDFTNKNGVYLKYDVRRALWHYLKPFMDQLNTPMNKMIITLKREIDPVTT